VKRLHSLIVAAALCFPSFGALAWWQSVQQVGVSGAALSTTTWNPADAAAAITLSGGNLIATQTGSTAWSIVRGIANHTTGKFYFESNINTVLTNSEFGVAESSETLTNSFLGQSGSHSIGWDCATGSVYLNGSVITTIQTAAAGDTVSVAYDLVNHMIWFRTNAGSWNNSGTADPATNTGGISFGGVTAYYPAAALYDATNQITTNFHATAYAQTVPSSFGDW